MHNAPAAFSKCVFFATIAPVSMHTCITVCILMCGFSTDELKVPFLISPFNYIEKCVHLQMSSERNLSPPTGMEDQE